MSLKYICEGNRKRWRAAVHYIIHGFPDEKLKVPSEIQHDFNLSKELSVYDWLVFKSDKILVPKSEIPRILSQIHTGHWDIQRCLRRARQFIYRKGQYEDFVQYILKCKICQSTQRSSCKELLKTNLFRNYHGKVLQQICSHSKVMNVPL